MQTQNGLTIHRVCKDRGGFEIELRAPAEHDPEKETFAVILRGDGGGMEVVREQCHILRRTHCNQLGG